MCSSLKVGQWIEHPSSTFLHQGVSVIFTIPSVQPVGQYPGTSATILHLLSFGGRLPTREVVDRFVLIHKVDKYRLDPPGLGLISDSGQIVDFNYSPELWTMDRHNVLKYKKNILGFPL